MSGASERLTFAAEKAADEVNKITSIEHKKNGTGITDGKGLTY